MRVRVVLPVLLAALAAPAAADAAFIHTVMPGESLSSIAAADGLSVGQLAAANGLSSGSQLILGSSIAIPPQGATGPLAAPAAAVSSVASSVGGDGDGDSDDVGGTAGASTSSAGGGSYVVQPGDTLTAIAARSGLSVDSLAAANGLSLADILPAGTVLRISGAAASASTSSATPVSTSTGTGSYVVQPGDTLTAIAARSGLSAASLAAANGLSLTGILPAGAVLHISGTPAASGTTSFVNLPQTQTQEPQGTVAQGNPVDPPYPTPERLSASTIAQIGAANGSTAALTDAIAWQESGFNNDLVSSADARGIMQILPGTWQWIQHSLDAGTPLAPASATDNVRGGSLMLGWLLNQTGGDPAMAAAGYYQGLTSVRQNGLLPDTQQYVNSVMALEHRFGGG
jgi:N-acetylmuramoyl-L-alanine amidase